METNKINNANKCLLGCEVSLVENNLKTRLQFLKVIKEELKTGENYWLTTKPNYKQISKEFVVNATAINNPAYCPYIYIYLTAYAPSINTQTKAVESEKVAEICAKGYRKHIFVENLVVNKNFRNNGVASAMLEFLNKIAYEHDKKEIVLYSCINMNYNNSNLTKEMKEFLNNKNLYEGHQEQIENGMVDANAVLYIQKNGFESIHENKEMLNKYGMFVGSLSIPMVKKVEKNKETYKTIYLAEKMFKQQQKKLEGENKWHSKCY